MNDLAHPNLSADERATVARKDFLTEVDIGLVIDSKTIPATLELYGRYLPRYAGTHDQQEEPAGYVLDRVMWRERDVTAALPDEAIETLTTYLNEVM